MKSLYSFLPRVQTASTLKLSESLATNPTENLLKKFILRTAGVLALFLFLGGSVWGQVSYTATRTTGITFNSISATGTSFTGWRNGTTNTDDNLSGSTNIGFNFTYDGAARSTFSVSTNGFLTFNTGTTALGGGTVAYGYSNTRFSSSTGSFLTLAPLYDDQVCVGNPNTAAALASSIKYELTGSAPNRILTVEWIGMEVFGNAGPNLNYQVKLFETTNNIEFVYGTMSASTATYTYSLGLNGTAISATPTSTQLYTQQTNNTATFSATPSNALATIPASFSKIIFTPPSVLACTGTPAAGTATITSATGCPSANFTLNSSGLTSGTGITYQWQTSSSAGGTYTNVGAAGSSLTTSTATTAYYKLKTTCSGSGLSNYSNVVSYTVVSCCTNTLQCYDSYGDGWNGGSVNLYVGGVLVGNYTIATGFGPTTVNFTTYTGQAIQVTLAAAGSYPTEIYFNVINSVGTSIVSNWYPYTSGTWNGTAVCPSPCSGTPAPGAAVSTLTTVTAGQAFTLSNTNTFTGTGLSYAWQSTSTSGVWPTISSIVNSDFASTPTNVTATGTAAITGGEAVLTTATGSLYGSVVIQNPSGVSNTSQSFIADFDYRIWDGVGADGLSFNYGGDVSTTSAGNGESGEGSGLRVSFVTYTSPQILVYYNNTIIWQNTSGAYALRNASYRNVQLSVNEAGYLNLSIAGTQLISSLNLGNSGYTAQNKSGWVFKISARTGGVNDKHSIDNLKIVKGAIALTPTYTTSEGSSMYYQCAVTCSGSTGVSTAPVYVQLPACSPPSALVSSAVTSSSATISWTAASPAPSSGYQYYVSTSSTAPLAGTTPTGSVGAGITTANLTGLSPNGTYYFWVRSNCGTENSAWAGSSTFTTPGYCIPVVTNGCTDGDVVARVILNTLDNNTGTGCPSGTLGYSNYTSDPTLTTTLLPSTSYNCIVYAGQYNANYAAWIDYNDNLVFEVSERIGYTTTAVTGSGTAGVLGSSASFPVTLACSPPAGAHRLRIREVYGLTGASIDPCIAATWGETEDYLITIAAAPACPSPGLMTTITTTSSSASLTWAANCASSTSYDFQYGPQGFTLGSGTTITNQTIGLSSGVATYTLNGLTSLTNYSVYYRANCGASVSAWSLVSNFTTLCNTPDYANLQSPASGAICSTGTFDVYGQVYEPSITPAAGQGSGITVQLGYSSTDTNPNTWTTWGATTFNVQSGNNDEYKGTLSGLTAGTYYYAFRYTIEGSCYVYGGTAGLWTTGTSGVLTVTAAPNAGTISSSASSLCPGQTVQMTSDGNAGGTWASSNLSAATISAGGMVTAVNPGSTTITYTVTGTGGCANAQATYSFTTFNTPDFANLQWPQSGAICASSGTFDIYGQIYESGLTEAAGAGAGITVQVGYSSSSSNPTTWTNWTSTGVTYNGQGGSPANNDEYKYTLSGLSAGTYYYTFRYAVAGGCYIIGGFNGGTYNGTSNTIGTLTVNPLPTASVTAGSAICSGSTASYTLTGTANATVSYSINGTAGTTTLVGGTATVTAANATTNQTLTLVSVTNSTTTCSQNLSANATVTVNPILTASVSIAATATTICSGTSVTFTATPTNGGTTPSYQWKVNGTNAGTNAATFTSTTLANNDAVTCVMTSNATPCLAGSPATSTSVSMVVNPTPVIDAMTTSLCSGSSFSVTPANETNGTVPSGTTYTWAAPTTASIQGLLAGSAASSISGTLFNTTNTAINAVYTVTPTAGTCSGTPFTVTVTVNALPVVSAATPAAVCAGSDVTLNGQGASTYVWSNGVTNGEAFFPTTTAYYSVTGTNTSTGCSNTGGVFVTVNASPTALVLTGTDCVPTVESLGTITSSTSTSGVTYQLYNADGVEEGSTKPGTGSALLWSGVPVGNGYYVIGTGTNLCTSQSIIGVGVIYVEGNSAAYTYYIDNDGDASYSTLPTIGCTLPAVYSLTVGTDCNDNNSAIRPGATEICGDGIDNDCSGSDAFASLYRSVGSGDWSTPSTWESSCDNSIWSLAPLAPTGDNYSTANPYLITVQGDHTVTVNTTSTTNCAKAGSLTINGTVSVTGKLTVVNALVNNGTLTINNGGSFVQNSTTTANSGNGVFNVNMTLSGSTNAAGTAANGRYWFIGSPMNNTPASTFYAPTQLARLWQYNAQANSWPSVITTTTNSSSLLVPGIGYLYRAGAQRTFTFTGGTSNFNNNITTSLLPASAAAGYLPVNGYSSSTGFKFVSNPYPSHVDWHLVTRTGLNVSYWIRTADNTNYESYNLSSGLSTNNISGQTNRFIPPMQGFYVYSFNNTPTLRVDNTDRVHSGNVLHSPVHNQVVRLNLNDGKTTDETVVYENENASNGLEDYDTYKMFDNQHHQLYFMEGIKELSMDGLKDATAKQKVDMGIQITGAGTYTINATELGVEEDVVLEDKFTHTFQDMKLNNTYSFTANAGTFNNRFVLHFTLTPSTETAIETETVTVGETVGESEGVQVYTTTGQQVKVWVTNTAEFQNATVKVYDAIGNLIERKNMTSNELYLNLDIASGIYVVEVTGANKTFTKKVFISK